MARNHIKNVLQFWRAVETFTLPDLPVRRNDKKGRYELEPGARLPWEPGFLASPPDGKQWKHTLYFFVVSKESVVDLLARLSGSKEFREPVGGSTCLSALVLDQLGQPVERGYTPASFIYGVKLLREKKNPEGLTELLKKANEDYVTRFGVKKEEAGGGEGGSAAGASVRAGTIAGGTGGKSGSATTGENAGAGTEKKEVSAGELSVGAATGSPLNIVNWALLQNELDYLAGLAKGALKAKPSVLCISEIVSATANAEAPFLNSYFVADLDTLIQEPKAIGKPLELLLTEQVDVSSRFGLLHQWALLQRLHPKDQSSGRWPADPRFGLYSAQQVALHLAMPGLRENSSLLGINGPPGTGKTTLLREVVADVVVSRAKRLLKADVAILFAPKWKKIVDKMGYYSVDRKVFGNDGIVVSSNNNTAVLNISAALPSLLSIDRETFTDAEYFSQYATRIHPDGVPCWAMISAVLGKADNRNSFVNQFWFNQGQGFGKYLKEQEAPGEHTRNLASYKETALELTGLLEEYAAFNSLASSYHELLLQILLEGKKGGKAPLEELATRLRTDYGMSAENLPGLDFLQLSLAEIHGMTPYSSAPINILRSKIFLHSLELHEWAIRVNAKYFRANLNVFVDLLKNKYSDVLDEEITADLWSSFFFCIPLVSVTLASFHRQFAKMGKGSIGWLLLDEAGQATPASTCGALWRAQRAIIIGDTLQIPPVVTIPVGLGKLLQATYQVGENDWSPLFHSAQFLADRVTATGTYIDVAGSDGVWTGIPLRAHRRCNEPMFSLANTIAYDNQMVKVAADVVSEIPTGPSGWIDVSPVTMEGHVIIEELQVLDDLLQQLKDYTGKIFIISPFRAVAEACYHAFEEKGRVSCGTIHTFQGKEAEIVFLVLGTQLGSVHARDWVAASPNMLNVAVTRAKERFYAIGNRGVWRKHTYFSELAEKLPVKEHLSGRLF